MNNKYSITLVIFMTILLLIGGIMGFSGNYFGCIPFFIGLYIGSGFKTLNDSPRQVGLISILGVKTTCKVEGLVLLFKPFGWKIVDVVVFEMRKIDESFDIDRVTCLDDAVVTGKVSASISPDESSGQALKNYDDAGQLEGIKKQLTEMFETVVQEIADSRPSDYMTTKGTEIGKTIVSKIEQPPDRGGLAGASNLGFKFNKLQIKLFKDSKVIEAEQKTLITIAMNGRITKRLEYLQKHGLTERITPAIIEGIRKQLVEEDMNSDGRLQEIRGGNLVNFNQAGGKK